MLGPRRSAGERVDLDDLDVELNAAGPLAASGARGVAAAQGSKRPRNEERVTTPLPPKGPEQAEIGDPLPGPGAGSGPVAPGGPWWSITSTSDHRTITVLR